MNADQNVAGVLQSRLGRLQSRALALGIAGVALTFLGAFFNARQFFISYFFGVLVWLGLALGCMCFLMIHHLTGGRWGWPVRRFLEAATRTLPLLAVLFVPVFFGLRDLYPWARAADVAADPVLQHKHIYMNAPAFVIRAVIFFSIWVWMTRLLNRWSLAQDSTRDLEPTRKLRTFSGPGVVIYPLTVTFAYIDWIMSLEPDWYSTMFLVLICIGQMLVALTFAIVLLAWLGDVEPIARVTTSTTFHHLGNLLLAFTMMWAYMAFSQLLIIWSGDLPHEIVWYRHRIAGGWRWVVAFLVLFHFFLPFFLLLIRKIKRNVRALTALAVLLFIAHTVDVFWLITPTFYPNGIRVSWMDFTALCGIGGVWLATFAMFVKGVPLLPLNDPRLPEVTMA